MRFVRAFDALLHNKTNAITIDRSRGRKKAALARAATSKKFALPNRAGATRRKKEYISSHARNE